MGDFSPQPVGSPVGHLPGACRWGCGKTAVVSVGTRTRALIPGPGPGGPGRTGRRVRIALTRPRPVPLGTRCRFSQTALPGRRVYDRDAQKPPGLAAQRPRKWDLTGGLERRMCLRRVPWGTPHASHRLAGSVCLPC